ncbi:3-phosphoshikimate 1-carboxyvinyltransferase [Marinicella sediminis]|uniref:Multifunctional fusion protein n=1 Tax=Marinicella sediminis TaxID=1792834 RepID=A0ABV7JBZ3_9GAMM
MAEKHPLDLHSLTFTGQLSGRCKIPGDKSISHRSVILGSLAEGETRISGFLRSEDCLATLNIMRQLGVNIVEDGDDLVVTGVGLHGLQPPAGHLDCGNAGTAMRLLSGLLAAQRFSSTLVGDESLSGRPMGRVITPLTQMGAQIKSDEHTAPLEFSPSIQMKAIDYHSPIASAQVKSAVLLAGLYADGVTTVTEPNKSRDHTETMLKGFGCNLQVDGLKVSVHGQPHLRGQAIKVPADVSSAAFFMVLGLCHPDADLLLENVNINPTRDGVIKILQAMGGRLSLENPRTEAGEAVADVRIQSSQLRGIDIPEALIPSAIDEFPVLFIAAALANGTTRLTGAEELRHKESDRITVMIKGLQLLGVDCKELPDGAEITGGPLHSGMVDGHGDHRCAMSFLLAGALRPEVDTVVRGCHNIDTSFPEFFTLVEQLGMRHQQPVPVVTIDGPSGVGKGTTSALLAARLGWHLLDSGAIYRSLALKVMNDDLDPANEAQLAEAAKALRLSFQADGQHARILLDGQQVNDQLRSEACGDMASQVAPIAAVRQALLQRQKAFQQPPGLVADGRDMGTVVFKSAPLKVFLTANAEERAKRRHKQLKEKGVDVKIRDLLRDIEARDHRDSTRKVAPLVPAMDAHVIDTSDLSIEEVLAQIMNLVGQHVKV